MLPTDNFDQELPIIFSAFALKKKCTILVKKQLNAPTCCNSPAIWHP